MPTTYKILFIQIYIFLNKLIGIFELFKPIFKDSRPTKNSGASNSDGDIVSPYFRIECKYRTTDNITIKKKVWDKLCSEIPIGSEKIPLLCYRNQYKDTWAVLHIADFIRLIKEVYNDKER